MKKWTVHLGLLLAFAAFTIVGSRIMVSKQKSKLALQEYRVDTKTFEKVQSTAVLQGLGRHLLDILK